MMMSDKRVANAGGEKKKPRILFWFEWGSPAWLWADNEEAKALWEYGPIQTRVPLSRDILARGNSLSDWYQGALNWSDPPSPSPWRQEECDRFNTAVDAFFADLQRELGDEYELINGQGHIQEDPELDEYLKNPRTWGGRK